MTGKLDVLAHMDWFPEGERLLTTPGTRKLRVAFNPRPYFDDAQRTWVLSDEVTFRLRPTPHDRDVVFLRSCQPLIGCLAEMRAVSYHASRTV